MGIGSVAKLIGWDSSHLMEIREPVLNRPVLDDLAVTKAPNDHDIKLNVPTGCWYSAVGAAVGSGPLQPSHHVIASDDEVFDVGLKIRKANEPAQDVATRALWPDMDAVARERGIEDHVGQPDISGPSLGEPSPGNALVQPNMRTITN
jgi:hypothetical protein